MRLTIAIRMDMISYHGSGGMRVCLGTEYGEVGMELERIRKVTLST